MPRGGRYRIIPVKLWGELGTLSPAARLVLVNMRTGSSSNIAGLLRIYIEGICGETGLKADEVEGALGELVEQGFIVRDLTLVWVRDQLVTDPIRERDPYFANKWHRRGVETIIGSLPQASPVVRRFARYYKALTKQGPSTDPDKAPDQGPQGPPEVPEEGRRKKVEGRTAEGRSAEGRRESEGRNQTPEVAHATVNEEILRIERRIYGRELTHLERKGHHPAPPRLS